MRIQTGQQLPRATFSTVLETVLVAEPPRGLDVAGICGAGGMFCPMGPEHVTSSVKSDRHVTIAQEFLSFEYR